MAEQNTNTNLITAKDIEKALLEGLNTAIRQKFKTDGKFVKDHLGYVKKIRTAEKPERYVRYIARKFIPDKEAYNVKIEKTRTWYRGELCQKLEKLYSFYHELSQAEEMSEITKNDASEIIEGLLNMFIE